MQLTERRVASCIVRDILAVVYILQFANARALTDGDRPDQVVLHPRTRSCTEVDCDPREPVRGRSALGVREVRERVRLRGTPRTDVINVVVRDGRGCAGGEVQRTLGRAEPFSDGSRLRDGE